MDRKIVAKYLKGAFHGKTKHRDKKHFADLTKRGHHHRDITRRHRDYRHLDGHLYSAQDEKRKSNYFQVKGKLPKVAKNVSKYPLKDRLLRQFHKSRYVSNHEEVPSPLPEFLPEDLRHRRRRHDPMDDVPPEKRDLVRRYLHSTCTSPEQVMPRIDHDSDDSRFDQHETALVPFVGGKFDGENLQESLSQGKIIIKPLDIDPNSTVVISKGKFYELTVSARKKQKQSAPVWSPDGDQYYENKIRQDEWSLKVDGSPELPRREDSPQDWNEVEEDPPFGTFANPRKTQVTLEWNFEMGTKERGTNGGFDVYKPLPFIKLSPSTPQRNPNKYYYQTNEPKAVHTEVKERLEQHNTFEDERDPQSWMHPENLAKELFSHLVLQVETGPLASKIGKKNSRFKSLCKELREMSVEPLTMESLEEERRYYESRNWKA